MERRTSERLMAVRHVTVAYTNLGLIKAETINISLGGMCIETGNVCLPVNAPVSLNFVVETEKDAIACEAHAIVVRAENSSCCLMFDGMDQKTHQALRSLVGDWHILQGSSGMNQVAAL